MSDVNFVPAKSITDLPITDPIHEPCPDMAGLEDYDPAKTKRARFLMSELRKKHGIKKRVKRKPLAHTYKCTQSGCVEPWGDISNANPDKE